VQAPPVCETSAKASVAPRPGAVTSGDAIVVLKYLTAPIKGGGLITTGIKKKLKLFERFF
jgi:hypothetical protein